MAVGPEGKRDFSVQPCGTLSSSERGLKEQERTFEK
jgi:hypothetical protein